MTESASRSVVFVSNAIANGGAGRVLCNLAEWFSGQGYEVTILVFAKHTKEYGLSGRINKVYLPGSRGWRRRIDRVRYIRQFAKQHPEATFVSFEHFVNLLTILALVGLNNRLVISERNDPSRVGSGYLRDPLRQRLYRRADVLVCQTDDAAAYFNHRINKTVILNPLSSKLPQRFQGERRRAVIAFCRLEAQKNLPMLVQAFAKFRSRYPDYTLEIYGDGKEREPLLALVEELCLADVVHIAPARSDVHEVARDCAMFVLPSNYEGLSNSMIEAMAIGLPTICTDCPCGGARMVIEDGVNGILVPVQDEAALVRAMSRVASSPHFAQSLGASASLIRERLNSELISSQWEQVLLDGSSQT